MIGNEELRHLIEGWGLVTDFIDLETQLQPTGFDLTVKTVERYTSGGAIDFDNTHRKIAESEAIPFVGGLVDGYIDLPPGVYRIRFNEKLNLRHLPYPISVISCYRGTVMRNGNYTALGFWDYGYEGRGECSFDIRNPHGFRVYANARIHQCFFFKATKVVGMYDGQYLFEE